MIRIVFARRAAWREYTTSLDARRDAAARALAEAVARVADPPVLTGALKASVHVETRDRSTAREAEARARSRRPKVRFARLLRPARVGMAYIGWRVIYATFVERRKPWLRRMARDGARAALRGDVGRAWRLERGA